MEAVWHSGRHNDHGGSDDGDRDRNLNTMERAGPAIAKRRWAETRDGADLSRGGLSHSGRSEAAESNRTKKS